MFKPLKKVHFKNKAEARARLLDERAARVAVGRCRAPLRHAVGRGLACRVRRREDGQRSAALAAGHAGGWTMVTVVIDSTSLSRASS